MSEIPISSTVQGLGQATSSMPQQPQRARRQKIGGSVFTDQGEKAVRCTICHDRVARYTCPECNLRYCNLECFKSETHLMCSESFYKRTLFEQIHADPKASTQSKTEMLKMLRRLEDQSLSDDEYQGYEDNDRGSESTESDKVLDQPDLDQLNVEELLKLLTPEQINDFQNKLQQPESDGGLFYRTIESHYSIPWWQLNLPSETNPTHDAGPDGCSGTVLNDYRATPNILPLHLLPVLPASPNLGLTFQIITVIFGYVYTLRRFGLPTLLTAFNLSPEDQTDVLLRTTEAVPLLFKTDSTTHLLASISDCQAFFFSTLDLDSSEIGEVGYVLISDFTELARPMLERSRRSKKIVELSSTTSVSESNHLASALSDLHAFLEHFSAHNTTSNDTIASALHTIGRRALKKAILKVRFYVSFVLTEPAGIDELWLKIDREINLLSKVKPCADPVVEAPNPSFLNFQRPSNQSIVEDITSTSAKIIELV
ncbi:hypothetical protein CROQUDRAFT_704402 [Cronartium quercuum f. sp. fusiforme G11]|uniref:HIT-type domain-containing protein n=1 Tax=Cronartium quercuum f. sp. fusiforme G11 TaxID=708437 RepID=A0A9P6TBS0_9BASI|nr:hypothetical protein CROQUDRAFT_704402 [Cronartium quercuum f. sp. fusiforme G11]